MFTLAIVLIALLGSTSAFLANSGRNINGMSLSMRDKSIALPFDKNPPNLDGTLPGDVGFDPAGFSNNPPRAWLIGGEARSLKWYREAEIVHGRIAQLAVLGNLVQGSYHFPGNPAFGVAENAFSETSPYKALFAVPEAGLWQIAFAIFAIEIIRIKTVIRGDKAPGDLGLGQGGFNPFGFKYTEEQYFEKQVQEIKHGRLAMIGSIGILLQAAASGKNIDAQLSEAFNFPDAVSVVRYEFISQSISSPNAPYL